MCTAVVGSVSRGTCSVSCNNNISVPISLGSIAVSRASEAAGATRSQALQAARQAVAKAARYDTAITFALRISALVS